MKLTAKLVSVLMLAIVVLNAAKCLLDLQRQKWLFKQLARKEAEMIGDAMDEMVVVARRDAGQAGVMELIRNASWPKHRMRIRWVWFDDTAAKQYRPAAAATPEAIEQHWPIVAPHDDGESYVHIYWLVAVDGGRVGGLELYESMSEYELIKWHVIYGTLLQTTAFILVAGLLAVVMGVRVVGRPLERLMEQTRRVGRGDLSEPIQLRSRDELGELAENLNRMCRQLAKSQAAIREETTARIAAMGQLRHVDRLRTVGRLASGVGHELGTPLNVVSGRAELISSGKLSDTEIADSARAIKTEAEKMTTTIRQLLDFARRSTPHRVSVDLQQVVRQTLQLLCSMAENQKVTLSSAEGGGSSAEGGGRLTAMVDVGQIQQVLTNLILNAIQAMPEGGPVLVDVRRQRTRPPEGLEGKQGQYYCISVRDQGVGISAEDIEHLFEPFFTTKDVGEGTGLGLSISYGIIREHGGWIEATSEPGKGSCFSVYLPQESQQ